MQLLNLDFSKIPVLGPAISWLRENDMDYAIHATAIAFLLLYFTFSVSDVLMKAAFAVFFTLAPLWFPYQALDIFHFRWMDYVTKKFFLTNGRTQYRIKLPQEVLKSPEAMEFVITQIWNTQNPDNLFQTYLDGKNPLPVSLEMVSIGGDVRFYVNMNTKKTMEAFVPSIYSQYPGIELVEEPVDYAAEITIGDPEWDVWSTHIGKKDPKKWGPIKTYIEFGLDKMPKEEEKTDPITVLLERLGDIGPNERLYFQFVLKAYRAPSFKNGQLTFKKSSPWTKMAQERVDELMQRDPETKRPLISEGSDFDGMPRVTPGEREDIEAIERNISKYAFNVGIRWVYMAKKGHFRPTLINPTNRVFSQFDKVGRAGLGVRWRTDFNYMWFSDPFGERLKKFKNIEQKFYKLRKFVNHNQKDHPCVMTTEEIATMFHIPGKVALTPTLERIPSTRSQAPTNLPVGDLPEVS